MSTIMDSVKKCMADKEINQIDLAERNHVSKQRISTMLQGNGMRVYTLVKLLGSMGYRLEIVDNSTGKTIGTL